jgi:hypothetical protein
MRRLRILAVLLFVLTSIAPWTGSAAEIDGECPSYPYCASAEQCPPGAECYKAPGQSCGRCYF